MDYDSASAGDFARSLSRKVLVPVLNICHNRDSGGETMKTDNKMGRLYQRLKEFGIDRSYVIKSVFPEGWLDAEASNPAVYSQALILLSRNLNLDMRALQPENAPLSWRPCSKTLFKRRQECRPARLWISPNVYRFALLKSHAAACPTN